MRIQMSSVEGPDGPNLMPEVVAMDEDRADFGLVERPLTASGAASGDGEG